MTYVKILESELNELIALKDEYHANCISLYNDIQNRDEIIKKIQAECMAACKERDDIIASMDESIVTASDASTKRTTVNVLMNNVNAANNTDTYKTVKEKYLL